MRLNVPRFKQKRITCGPSSLQQVLAFYGKNIPLKEMLKEIKMTKSGTWSTYLAMYAMKQGFEARIITYDTNIFDPTWINLSRKKLIKKLKTRLKTIKDKKLKWGYNSIIEYLKAGGKLEIKIPTKELLISYLKKGIPSIVALSCTALWKTKRKIPETLRPADIKGKSIGHFIVINGYNNGEFDIVDPHWDHSKKGIYKVSENELLFAWYFWGGWLLIIEKVKK